MLQRSGDAEDVAIVRCRPLSSSSVAGQIVPHTSGLLAVCARRTLPQLLSDSRVVSTLWTSGPGSRRELCVVHNPCQLSRSEFCGC